MSSEFRPRITSPVLEHAHRTIALREGSIREYLGVIEEGSDRRLQNSYRGLANDYLVIAYQRYALGHPIEEVRDQLCKCAESWRRVFELRGTTPAASSLARQLHQEAKEYSTTNSKNNIRAVCIALAARDFGAAERIASLAWDPPHADYVSPQSEVCRTSDQHLAYAVSHLFAGRLDETLRELKQVRARPKEIRPRETANLVRALATDDTMLFYDAIRDLLEWHERSSPEQDPYEFLSESDKFICIWGTGLCAWALRRGLLPLEDLPQGNVYLPLELIA